MTSNASRLSRAGNRRINRVLHIMAICALRTDTEGRRYYDHKVAAGKTRMEAMRCLKRRLSDIVYSRSSVGCEPAPVRVRVGIAPVHE